MFKNTDVNISVYVFNVQSIDWRMNPHANAAPSRAPMYKCNLLICIRLNKHSSFSWILHLILETAVISITELMALSRHPPPPPPHTHIFLGYINNFVCRLL